MIITTIITTIVLSNHSGVSASNNAGITLTPIAIIQSIKNRIWLNKFMM